MTGPPPYEVKFRPRAYKQLQRLPQEARERMVIALAKVAHEPRQHGCIPLKGRAGYWRVRAGDYRAIYLIADELKLVTVRTVDHRSSVYDR